MEPSSLIFLVIIGIWAAYFVQYWVRRREHLATIRSVDAFSQTMRVLERRAPLPSVDTDGQAPRTYAVSPARAMRPQVTVKRAEAAVVERRGAAPTTTVSGPAPERRPEPSFVAEHESEEPTMSPSRATRGIVLLVGLLGTVVFGVLAAFGVLVAWSPLVPLLMAVAGFAWLRAGVQGEIRARREARRSARPAAARTERRPVAARTRTEAVAGERRVDDERVAEPVAEREAEAEVVAEAPAEMPFDVTARTSTPEPAEPVVVEPAAETVAEQPVAEMPAAQQPVDRQPVAVVLPEVDEDDIPLTWDPRPVPRPTYTMKARAAERPAPEPEPAAEAEPTAYDEVPERRIVGG